MRTVILIFILVITTLAYSQKKNPDKKVPSVPEHLKSFFEMRKRMMEEMNKVMPGHTFGDSQTSPFDDPFFEQFFSEEDFIKGFHEKFQDKIKDQIGFQNDFYQSSWEENDQERILVLKPINKETPLDINIKDGMIQITVKSDKKGQNLSYMSSESLPSDVDEKKLKIEQRGDDILVRLPKVVGKSSNKSKIKAGEDEGKEKLKPLKAAPGDVTI